MDKATILNLVDRLSNHGWEELAQLDRSSHVTTHIGDAEYADEEAILAAWERVRGNRKNNRLLLYDWHADDHEEKEISLKEGDFAHYIGALEIGDPRKLVWAATVGAVSHFTDGTGERYFLFAERPRGLVNIGGSVEAFPGSFAKEGMYDRTKPHTLLEQVLYAAFEHQTGLPRTTIAKTTPVGMAKVHRYYGIKDDSLRFADFCVLYSLDLGVHTPDELLTAVLGQEKYGGDRSRLMHLTNVDYGRIGWRENDSENEITTIYAIRELDVGLFLEFARESIPPRTQMNLRMHFIEGLKHNEHA